MKKRPPKNVESSALPEDTVLVAEDSEPAELHPLVSSALGRRRLILLITAVMYIFGLVMVTSATSGKMLLTPDENHNTHQWAYLIKQLQWGALGFFAMWMAMRIPMRIVRRFSYIAVVVATVLLLLVFVPGLGIEANGATRWIGFGPFQMQPSELVKLATIIFVADFLATHSPPKHWYRDFVKSPGGLALGLSGIIFVQHDLGTAMVTAGVTLAMYMLRGTDWRVLFAVVGPAVILVGIGILATPFRRQRFLAFLDPWADPQGPGYQLVQGLIAIGSGGPFGVGLGHSVEKIFYLPEAHTDMMFSIVAEELGLFGVAVVVVSFMSLCVVGFRIAVKAGTKFESLLAAGLTSALCGQAVLNIAGVVGVLPLTGVPLPLVSYGGSSLIITLTSLGLLANIAVSSHVTQDTPTSPSTERTRRSWWNGRPPVTSSGAGRQPA